MTDDRLLHRWDKGSAAAKCIDCGVGAITPQGLQHCPGKRVEAQPRVWVGRSMDLEHWEWSDGHWFPNCTIYAGDIFMVCTDEPTIDPAEMETIRTCKEIDWNE